MSNTLHIYTTSNWRLVRYLWPMGTLNKNQYTVFLDVDSEGYQNKLDRLRKVSPWLADCVAVWSEVNGVTFTVHCPTDETRKS